MRNTTKILGWGLGSALVVGGLGGGLFLLKVLAGGEASLYMVSWIRTIWLLSVLAGGVGAGFAANRKGWLAGGMLGLFLGGVISLAVLQVVPDTAGIGIARALLASGGLFGSAGGVIGINGRDRLFNLRGIYMNQGKSRYYRG